MKNNILLLIFNFFIFYFLSSNISFLNVKILYLIVIVKDKQLIKIIKYKENLRNDDLEINYFYLSMIYSIVKFHLSFKFF